MQAKPVPENYRPDIDGLRAISIVLVLFHHAVPEAKSGGFVGVDIFFVISGYLITSLLLREIATGPVNYLAFFWRRFCRLVPSLLVVLSAVLAIGYLFLFPDEFASLGRHALAGLFFTSNLLHWTEAGYFDQSSYSKPLLHLWSLGIEEQFYIFWPFFLAFFAIKRSLFLATTLAVAVSFVINLVLTTSDATSAFYLPFGRFWELGAGALLAMYQTKANVQPEHKQPLPTQQNLMAILGLGMIIASFMLIRPDPSFPGWKVLLPVIGTLLLLYGRGSHLNRVWLSHPALVSLGLISYALYLWHWPLISFVQIMWGTETPPIHWRLIAVAMAVLLAALTYRWVEKPARRMKLPQWRGLASWLTPIALLSLVALGISISGGLPNRSAQLAYQDNQSQLERLEDDPVDSHALCKRQLGITFNLRYCNVSGPNPSVALIGDSHARAAYEAVATELKSRGLETANVGGRLFLGINSYLRGSQFELDNNNGSILATQSVIDNPALTHVVMFAFGPPYISDRADHVFESTVNTDLTDPDDVWEAGLRYTFDQLLAAGKNVTFVLNNPDLDFEPRACLSRPYASIFIKPRACDIAIETFHARNDHYRELMQRILGDYPTIKTFDLATSLCDDQRCSAMRDGKLLYRDDDHLSRAGAELIAPDLVTTILQAP